MKKHSNAREDLCALYEAARTGDKRLVASMTGHTENSKAFSRYSEVTRDMKLAALGLKEKDPTSPDVEPSVKTKIL